MTRVRFGSKPDCIQFLLPMANMTLRCLQWDRAISSMIIRSSLGLSFGVVFSVLLFKRRAWPAWVGLGFGAGRAWEEADGMCMAIDDRYRQ
jgi:inner membrane organizing system protein 1